MRIDYLIWDDIPQRMAVYVLFHDLRNQHKCLVAVATLILWGKLLLKLMKVFVSFKLGEQFGITLKVQGSEISCL